MAKLFQPLLFFLARCTENDLCKQIEFLKAENEMLRKRVEKKRIFLTNEERKRLLKLGRQSVQALPLNYDRPSANVPAVDERKERWQIEEEDGRPQNPGIDP